MKCCIPWSRRSSDSREAQNRCRITRLSEADIARHLDSELGCSQLLAVLPGESAGPLPSLARESTPEQK